VVKRYDVFLSFKNLSSDGKPTQDSVLAADIYQYLSTRNLSVFLSTFELEAQGVSDFKKAIDEALDASRVLIAVGTNTTNLTSEWVRYEWDSFFNDIISGVKPDSRVFAYVDGVEFKTLPRALRQSQAITHRDGSLELLYRFVTNALNIETVPAQVIVKQRSENKPVAEVESVLREIDNLIRALANFNSNPEAIYYIGQTLVECDTFLDDYRINDEATNLIDDLIEEIDTDERRKEGLFDPVISVGKVRKLIHRLRDIRKRFMRPA
jgi:hypothetical protein